MRNLRAKVRNLQICLIIQLKKTPTKIFSKCVFQVRSHTSVRCVGKRSARAPTSSRTAGNTPDTNHSAATSVAKVSRGKWTWGGTKRRSTDWSEAEWSLHRPPDFRVFKLLLLKRVMWQKHLFPQSPHLRTFLGSRFTLSFLKTQREVALEMYIVISAERQIIYLF